MTRLLTVVMYHYVRDLSRTRYPAIKGLLTDKFVGQLDYIQKHYTVVSMQQCIEAYLNNAELADNACLLTFDDGFIDHYLTVFPLLYERGLAGAFFPPAQAILEKKMLGVHKIHFILASTKDIDKLVSQIYSALAKFRSNYELPTDSELYSKLAIPSRFDPPAVVFVKTILQRELPEEIRTGIIDELFRAIVSEDEQAFAEELYMKLEHLKMMAKENMYIGGHGYKHNWIGRLAEDQQREEIALTIGFLSKIYGGEPNKWAMSYPYGDYNEGLVDLLQENGCVLGLTTDVDLAPITYKARFKLPRLDTNDLPISRDEPISHWTIRIQSSDSNNR